MLDDKRKLRYIPLFYNDLENAADYIANTIGNVQAAIELLDKVEVAILNRLPIADAFEPYILPEKNGNRITTKYM